MISNLTLTPKADRDRRKQAKARRAQIAAQKRARVDKRGRRLNLLKRAWRGVSLVWKVLGVILVLLGAVSTFYFYAARVSVTPGATVNDANPFATMFVLHNEGAFPIYNLKFGCRINKAESSARVAVIANSESRSGFTLRQLDANARTSSQCHPMVSLNAQYDSADVSITASYRPSFSLFRKTQYFRFGLSH
jgi:hypothetical protein